jgi:predicted Na+-dependent transporter
VTNRLRQLCLVLAAIAAVGLAVGFTFGQPIVSQASAVVLAVGIAIGAGAIPVLRGYQYTFWIVAAVVSAMVFPGAFLRWGPVDLRNKWLVLIVIQLVMFGMGTQMSIRDFAGVVLMPRGVIIGILGQLTIMPLVGYALTRIFNFPPEIAAGVVLIGACSSGLASNVITYLARANLPLSVTLSMLGTVMAPLVTPLWMKLLAGAYVPIDFFKMMMDIVQIVLVPVGAAMLHDYLKFASPRARRGVLFIGVAGAAWLVFVALVDSQLPPTLVTILAFIASAFVAGIVYHGLTRLLPRLDRVMPMASMFGIVYFTAITTAAGRDNLLAVGALLFLAAVLHNAFGYALGYGLARLTGLNRTDARTLAIEVGLQNGGMAGGIANGMGKLGTVGLAAAIFSPWMNVSGSILANYWRRRPVDEPIIETPQTERTETMTTTTSKSGVLAGAVFLSAIGLMSISARAQYPSVPPDVQQAADEAKRAADQRSDEAFAKAMPVIDEWSKKGKPYIPGAAKPEDLPQAKIPAFPGAEGGGMYSFGGRGGKVFVVTSLEDSGPGTLREACEAGGPRVVVFNVAGIIRLKDRIRIRAPYITISGASAPGDGVCVAGNTVELETHDVVVRHLRFRRGETNAGDRNDSIGGNPIGNVIIDHVSASWGLDENMSMYRHMYRPPGGERDLKLPTVNITIQNSIFSECLNTYNHSFGSTIGGYNSTFHHNLWASNAGRNPSIGMNGDFGFFNNVVFNWVHRTTDGGDHLSFYNIINNYWKPGPATPRDRPIAYRILKPEARRGKDAQRDFGKAYVNGNVVEGNDRVTKDNWDGGVQVDDGHDPDVVLPKVRVDKPFPHNPVTITPAEQAYSDVLANAGATLPTRDAVDRRIIEFVRTGKVGDVSSNTTLPERLKAVKFSDERINEIVGLGAKGIISDPAQVGGYPEYKGASHKDADADGMPDEWETKQGLNANDPADALGDKDNNGYSNVEDFLNSLAR